MSKEVLKIESDLNENSNMSEIIFISCQSRIRSEQLELTLLLQMKLLLFLIFYFNIIKYSCYVFYQPTTFSFKSKIMHQTKPKEDLKTDSKLN